MFGLNTGQRYQFRVFSVNFNGVSDPSSIISVYACGLPSNFDAPDFVQSDQTSIMIKWTRP